MAKRKMAEDVMARRVAAADKATSHGVTESQQQTRQTYYVPEDLHRELKVAAITRGMKVSDLVCEGIREVLKRHHTR